MTTKNPWRGIASYEEPQGTSDDYLFCGRDEETLEVVRLIDNNLFITLYGSSGIGKTSLLKAGVMPILKRRDYYPLYVRLSQEPTEITYAEAIVRRLQSSGLKEERGIEMVHPDSNDRLYLWNYFATTRFLNDEGREVYPVIILDQFEEVFRDADKRKAESLLQQIYLLLNDELEMPNQEGYNDETNYRFVASIREDFLFVLEDSIDEFSLDLYKNNRYRLRPMKPENARQVVLVPGKDCIEEHDKNTVADKIVALAKRNEKDDIDTLLLSLVCAGTFDKKAGEKIAATDLTAWKDNPMEVYYKDAVRNLSAKQIRYIQQHLIREDGSRKRVDADKAKAALGENTYHALTRGENRMLVLGEHGQVELLHDQLAMAVYEERKAFEERERKKKLRRRIWLIGSIMFLIMVFFLILACIIGDQQQDLKRNQSRFVAEKAQSLLEENNPNMAELLCLEVSPKNMSRLDRPYIPEIERILRQTDIYHYTKSINYDYDTKRFRFNIASSNDGNYLLVYDRDTMLLYDASSFRCIHLWEPSSFCNTIEKDAHWSFGNGASISCDNNTIAVACHDDKIRVVDIETGNCQQVLEYGFQDRGNIEDCAFSSDKNKVTAIWESHNGNIFKCITWNISSGARVITDVNSQYHSIVALSKDGTYMAFEDGNDVFAVVDIETGQKRTCRLDKLSPIAAMSFTPDASKLFIGSQDGLISIYDMKSGEVQNLLYLRREITSLSTSHDGKKILVTAERAIGIFDAFNGSYIAGFEIPNSTDSHFYKPRSACFGPNDTIVNIASLRGINQWTPKKRFHIIETPFDSWVDVAFSPNGKHLLCIPQDTNTFCLFDLEGRTLLHTFDTHEAHRQVSYSPDGNYIAAASSEGTLLWDATTWNCIKEMPDETIFAFSPGNQHIITGSADTIKIWDLESGMCEKAIPLEKPINVDYLFSPDDKYIIVGENQSDYLYIYNSRNGKLDYRMENPHIINATMSSDGRRLVVATDSTINVWSIRWGVGTCRHQIAKEKSDWTGICISPDNKYLSTGEHVYELLSGKIVANKAPFYIESSFSPDGKYLLDGDVVYEWETGTSVGIISEDPGVSVGIISEGIFSFRTSSFSPDGKQIILSARGGSIVFYDFHTFQELIDQTRERFKDRPLTPEERRMYYLE